jgi:hypothetical protein
LIVAWTPHRKEQTKRGERRRPGTAAGLCQSFEIVLSYNIELFGDYTSILSDVAAMII